MPRADQQERFLYHRVKRLPDMIEATERKLAGLYREARRYKMDEVLTNKHQLNEAWEREILVAMLEASDG